MKLKIGDKVKLNKNVEKFRYGKGAVDYNEIGTIIQIDMYKNVRVNFPSCSTWRGLEKELVLVNKEKFFKKLPNDFTGTIEVKNGYIVEKEILDKEEKEYLTNVIKPFKKNIKCIAKRTSIFEGNECIAISLKNDDIIFPFFKKGSMYKGMEPNKNYSLEELNLKEAE